MTLVDANILLYAYDKDSPQHSRCLTWLERSFEEGEAVAFCWTTIIAFLRISTDARVFRNPLDVREAEEAVKSWLEQPTAFLLGPSADHWASLTRLLRLGQAKGALITDAHIAAIALEHGATVCTNDRDFHRFPGLKLINPLES